MIASEEWEVGETYSIGAVPILDHFLVNALHLQVSRRSLSPSLAYTQVDSPPATQRIIICNIQSDYTNQNSSHHALWRSISSDPS
jgi:hypothetical protein